MRWDEDIKVKRPVWNGHQLDSQLECDWMHTLDMWGMEYVYHPGRIVFNDGSFYEPDFQLDGDILLEVKGGHDARIHKPLLAREMGHNVIIARSGFVPAGSNVEYAGAVWDDEDWVVVQEADRRPRFVRDGPGVSGLVTAHLAYARAIPGIRMFKAVHGVQVTG